MGEYSSFFWRSDSRLIEMSAGESRVVRTEARGERARDESPASKGQ